MREALSHLQATQDSHSVQERSWSVGKLFPWLGEVGGEGDGLAVGVATTSTKFEQSFGRRTSRSSSHQSRFVSVDARHVFMSGTVQALVDAALLHMQESEEKCILTLVIMRLGERQFILLSELPEPSPIFQVLCGTGMGLAHSGNLTDLALVNLSAAWTLRR